MSLSQASLSGIAFDNERQTIATATPEHRRNSEASIAPLSDGGLLLAFTRFEKSASDHASASVMARISRDGGEQWGEPFEICAHPSGGNVMAPSLLRLSSGEMALSYIEKNADGKARMLFALSNNERDWNPPTPMAPAEAYQVCLNDTLIELPGGRILQPLYECDHTVSCAPFQAYTVYSDDKGATWHRSENQVECPGRGAMEPVVFFDDSGQLVMLLRTDQGVIWRSESCDAGEHWGPATPTQIVSPQAPCMVRTLPERSAIALCWNTHYEPTLPHGGPRRELAVALSYDGGKQFGPPLVLENSDVHSFAYPSLLWHQDRLHATYYHDTGNLILGEHPDLRLSLIYRRLKLL